MWDRFHVVRCGIDLEAFPLRVAPVARERPRIVTVARLSPEKGHLVLLEALRELADQGVHAELRIVGDGPSGALISDTAERLGLADRVALLGEMEPGQVAAELADADVFCLASFYVGGIPELAVDGTTALVVPASNATALASSIRGLLDDPGLRSRLVDAARRAVSEQHDIRTNVSELRRLFATYAARG
jgi:glycosyltransferase involved in cell wall biosynthesis